jgi:hypothetical protein
MVRSSTAPAASVVIISYYLHRRSAHCTVGGPLQTNRDMRRKDMTMLHAWKDYNERIQDSAGDEDEDEEDGKAS